MEETKLTTEEKINYINWGLNEYKDCPTWEDSCNYIRWCLKEGQLDKAVKVLDSIHDGILELISADS